jgi:transcriptional antiterminator NusG
MCSRESGGYQIVACVMGPRVEWYAVRVRSNYEKRVADALQGKDIEQFVPMYRRRVRWSDRMRERESPLFAGYVFAHFDVERRLPVLQLSGVVSIVGCGKTPQPIDHGEIDALRLVAATALSAEPWPYLRVGDAVRVDRGPLAGLEGRLVSVRKSKRLIVAVSLLQRAVAVEIEEHWVTPVAVTRSSVGGPGGSGLPVARPIKVGLRQRRSA